jgi:hypothetical protein
VRARALEFYAAWFELFAAYSLLLLQAVAASRCARITSAEQVTTALVVGQKRTRTAEESARENIAPAPSCQSAGAAQGMKKYGGKKSLGGSGATEGFVQGGMPVEKVAEEHGREGLIRAMGGPDAGKSVCDVIRTANGAPERGQGDAQAAAQTGSPALLGVKVIWVSRAHRREHIAHELLDCARRCLVFGTVIPVSSVAFSQPTEDGFALAVSYCRSDSVLAYA